MRRVVITGMGAVTSCGMGVKPLWKQVLEGRHGFCTITGFDTSDFVVKYAAEISNWDPVAAGLNKKEARRMDRFSQFAMAAANLAMEQAGNFAADLDPFRIGVLVSSGIGGFHSFEEEKEKAMAKGVERVSVFFIPMMIPNMAGGLIAIQHGFKGENYCPVSACASSAHAVGEAFRKIKYGYLDACVTGGAEAAITQFALAGFYNMGALAVGEDPARLSIPFDKERKGFVMGEGAAVLVLEELEHAYLMPQIQRIYAIEEEFGVLHWHVLTDRGERHFEMRGRDEVQPITPDRFLVRDIDGNRYEIADVRALDRWSQNLIHTHL